MGLLGSILKGAGEIAGGVSKVGLKITGEIVGYVADELGAYDFADSSRNIGEGLGELSNTVLKATGNIAGTIIDTTIDVTTEIGGGVGILVAKGCGTSDDNIDAARNIGKIVGGAAGGLLVGDVIGAGIIGVTAATGLASTGTAISSLHGAARTGATIANIGGGALSAGGGGIAAGQAVLNGINVATTAGGMASSIKKKENITYEII